MGSVDMNVEVEKDYYAVLGVSPFATGEEIKSAYRRLARLYHPDSREAETATRLFHEVHEAYAALSDASARMSYDRQRDIRGLDETAPLTWKFSQGPRTLTSESDRQPLFVLGEIRSRAASPQQRLPLDLAIVIDTSTSMNGARLLNVKEAARRIVDQLQDEDYLAIVSFNDRADLLVSDQVGTSRARARTAITSLQAEGGTELLKGLSRGLRELGAYRGRDMVSHLVLLTDGRTYGDDEACVALAASAGDEDIGITAMGIGEDWNDELLDEMASRSGGSSDYISSPAQVHTLLHGVIRRLSSVFATELILSIRAAAGVSVEGVFQTMPSLEHLHVSEGVARLAPLEMGASRGILIESAVEGRSPGDHRLMQIDLYGEIPSLGRRRARLRQGVWCQFTDGEISQADVDTPAEILQAVARVVLYRTQERAWSALAKGEVDQAASALRRVATQLFEMGEEHLAQAALRESKHIAAKRSSTGRGRKRIKYGTRRLGVQDVTSD